jgi:integrase
MNDYHVFKKQERVINRGAFAKRVNKTGIFTEDELIRLFNPELYTDKALRLYYLCCLSGALRTGEARGLRAKQILFDRKALIVDGLVKSNGMRVSYKKQGTAEHPKFRIVPLPDIALNLLREHIAEHQVSEDGFVFRRQKEPDKPITACYAHNNLKRIMKKAEIEPDGRKLIVNSFRFTYITYMRRLLPVETMMKPVIHKAIRMTDYYTKQFIDESPPRLTGVDAATANLFS